MKKMISHGTAAMVYIRRKSKVQTGFPVKKLKLLVWKNFLLQKRHKWQTLFEILSPVLFSLLLVLVRCLVEPIAKPAIEYPPFKPTDFKLTQPLLGPPTTSTSKGATIAFSPENTLTRAAVVGALKQISKENPGFLMALSLSALPEPLGFKNAKAMEESLTRPGAMKTVLVGIQFDDSMEKATEWPENMELTLRFPAVMRTAVMEHLLKASWRTNLLYPLFPKPGPRQAESADGGWLPGYAPEMFLAFQHSVSQEIIKAKVAAAAAQLDSIKILMQRLPQLAYRDDKILIPLEMFISLIIMLSFAYTAVNTVKVVAAEKELQLKETMSIMGLQSWLHWLAWFIKQYSFLFASVILMSIMFKIPWKKSEDGVGFAVLTYTPWSVLTFFLLLYTMATLTFCFMISVFFSKSNTAASFMGLAWFLTYSVYMLTQAVYEHVTFPAKLFMCLFSNTAMAFVFQMMIMCEGTTRGHWYSLAIVVLHLLSSPRGLQWGDFFTSIAHRDPFKPGHVMLMLILDTILYMLITIYVEKISPGTYGVPLVWYYPCTKAFWLPSKTKLAASMANGNTEYEHSMLRVVHEKEPQGGIVGVNIANLTKAYTINRRAVDNLNIRMYQNEITILLGHNGAGKTTTISMLTGMIPPTSGVATIDGYDIVKETKSARMSLGLCPQHNVLFPDLTVAEHVEFYSRLKGVPDHKIREEIDHFVTLLELAEKRDVLSSFLSGGQQRRLSVGAAMCGSSRVVLLDEPTSGLDPAARRALWDLLQREKKGRTIILSTHFMDEADILGDRIAIMAGGRLQCVGSPDFLKKHYGGGYKLVIAKTDKCDVEECTKLLRTYVPDVKENTDIGSELSYILPTEAVPHFNEMLKELERRSAALGVASYGLSVTTLEEVFMKAGAEDFSDDNISNLSICSDGSSGSGQVPGTNELIYIEKVKGYKLLRNHIKAMFLKHGYTAIRNRLQTFIQILTPIINILVTVHIARSWRFIQEQPSLKLTLESGFEYTDTLMSHGPGIDPTQLESKAMEMYGDYFKKASNPNMVLIDLGESSLPEYYRMLSTLNPSRVRHDVLVGVTFSPGQATAWFSNSGYHDCAISLALLNNAILRALSPTSSLTVFNYPLPYTFEEQGQIMASGGSLGFQLAFNMGFCMAFVTAFIVLFSIKERVSGSKLLQRASGVQPAVMWGCAFIWDWLWFMAIVVFLLLTLGAFREKTLATFPELGRLMVVFMFFGFAAVPVHYLAAFVFEAPATGFSKMCFFNVFTGVVPYLITEILKLPNLGNVYFGHMFDWLFAPLPAYCISRGLKELSMTSFSLQACDSMCEKYLEGKECTHRTICDLFHVEICCMDDDPYFHWFEPGIGRYLGLMFIMGIICFTVLLCIEYEVFNKIRYVTTEQPPAVDPAEEEPDVLEERNLVQTFNQADLFRYSLVCRDLSKYYKNFLAVHRLSFAVRKGECFGLLGINGAGKTTTFKMLTGDVRISSGDVWIHGMSIKTNIEEVHQKIGYCPQFDALLDNLTGRETLRIYCLLRGIPMHIGSDIAEELTHRLGIRRHLDKRVYEYSGGSKRKLSTALALLGDAPLIFLDEPSTGMDPASKRRVWTCLAGAVRAGRSAVLSSHSMEECEALCTRLTIMAGGRMHCLGSLQHLKTKFSSGYTLIVKCSSGPDRDTTVNLVHEYIMANFKNPKLIETYLGISTYYVAGDESWWRMFEQMEAARALFSIEDYSVSQTSLEQLFMRFSRIYAARDWSVSHNSKYHHIIWEFDSIYVAECLGRCPCPEVEQYGLMMMTIHNYVPDYLSLMSTLLYLLYIGPGTRRCVLLANGAIRVPCSATPHADDEVALEK